MNGRLSSRLFSPDPDRGGGPALALDPLRPLPRPGDVVSGGTLPHGASYVVGEALPPRWGLLRWRGSAVSSGRPVDVELWQAQASLSLPAPLRRLSLSKVRHRNLQAVLGIGTLEQDGDGYEVAVLEAPSGTPLPLGREALPPARALFVLEPLARALDALHAAGLCHLELRPEHVYLTSDERDVVLGGLGQVQPPASPAAGSSGEWPRSEGTPMIALLGRCAYLAPEQLLPERADQINRRTDVYALSALAFHLLTGAPPFGPDGDMATLGAHLAAWRPLASTHRPDLGEAVDAVLQRGLSLESPLRPPSCGEMIDDLRAALSAMPQPGPAESAGSAPCALVVAGTTAARRELQGLIAAVSPRHVVLADAGEHTRTLALRYRPQVVLLHQPSLAEERMEALCRDLCRDPALAQTQVVAVMSQGASARAQELAGYGAMVTQAQAQGHAGGHSSASTATSSQTWQTGQSGRTPERWPLVQLLRRLLSPARTPSRR